MSSYRFTRLEHPCSSNEQARATLDREAESPLELSRLQNRVTIQADRIDRLVAALRDCKLRLAVADQREAELAERMASISWRVMETISRINARIAPLGSKRRRFLHVGYRTLRALSRFRSPRYAAGRLRSLIDRAFHRCFDAALEVIRFHRAVRFDPPCIPKFASVRASIVILADSNQDIDTLTCLKSIVSNDAGISYELIVIDESSTGRTARWLNRIPGLVVLRSPPGPAFSASLIGGATVGDYLVFLDNTTQVTPGWLAALVETFLDLTDVGLAVPKVLRPDGRLKHAGRAIGLTHGEGAGKSDDPDHPRHNFVCELDSCSPECIIIPRELFNQIGGFDRCPDAHEDAVADLISKMRGARRKVMYQPLARIIHGDRLTLVGAPATTFSSFSAIKQPHFHDLPRSTTSPGQVLVIDHWLPTPDKDAGSLRMMEIVKAIRRRGNHVAFVPASMVRVAPYAQDLQRLGVEVVYQPYYVSVDDYLERHGREFDLVIISRAEIASRYFESVKRLAPRAKLVFDTVDLHFVREERAAQLLKVDNLRRAARRRKRQELAIASQCDLTLVVSPVEKAILESECPGIEVRLLPTVIDVPSDEPAGYEDRQHLLFVGGFGHDPNIDAVFYFVEAILPLIVKRLPDVLFQVVGSNVPASIRDLAGTNVQVLGYVPDVTPLFDTARVSVASLRFGAGVKGKVNQSMALGVPTVVTSIAAEGMHLVHEENAMIAEDPASFADAVVRLWTSKTLWERISKKGRESVREHFSVETAYRRIDRLLAFAGL